MHRWSVGLVHFNALRGGEGRRTEDQAIKATTLALERPTEGLRKANRGSPPHPTFPGINVYFLSALREAEGTRREVQVSEPTTLALEMRWPPMV